MTENYYFDNQTKAEVLTIARKTLSEFLSTKKILVITPKNKILQQPMGAFVTLKNNDRLRGCIGLIETDQPLYKIIQEVTIASATKDPRFNPVTLQELKDIIIEVSILTPKNKIKNWKDIKLGTDGVMIEQGWHKAVFLPQVAQETGWDLERFLSTLCTEKAGLPADCYKNSQTIIYVFQTQIFTENK